MKIDPYLSEDAKCDGELIIAARMGAEKAFALLKTRYKDAIYYMLLRMVYNKADAKELTADTFRKAFTNIHQYNPPTAFSTWLFSIAANNAIDFLRNKKVNAVPFDSSVQTDKNAGFEYSYTVKTFSASPEGTSIRKQNVILVRKSVSSLKPLYRKLLKM